MKQAFVLMLAAALGCGRLKPAATDAAADAVPGPDAGGRCSLGVSPIDTTACAAHPMFCGNVCGDACVDLATDGEHCGACGVTCAPHAACNEGVCGATPGVLVAPAPGCRSLRLVHEAGSITWADLGHGTLKRISTAGGVATTLATDVRPAAIYAAGDQALFVNSEPVAAGILVNAGTVYWIEADDAVTLDEAGLPHGGGGVAIRAVSEGAAPRTLLPATLAPGSPTPPPISAIALSPDARTLYFAAGTRLYKIPSAGAVTPADVTLVGFTSGPEHGFATSLSADAQRLFFPSTGDDWIEILDLTRTCDSAAAGSACPALVFGSHPLPLLDTVVVKDGYLYWAKENNVWRADLREADPTLDGHATASDTMVGFAVTGFAVGARHAYFGENVYVERGDFAAVTSSGPPPARVLARGQTWPSSFALDGTNVYWTTTACDISFIADGPQ